MKKLWTISFVFTHLENKYCFIAHIFKKLDKDMVQKHVSLYMFIALRSTAQLISYELILSSAILLVILLTGSLNLTVNIEAQRAIWFVVPLFPVFIIFFIGSVAETNRAPFDLAEAISLLPLK